MNGMPANGLSQDELQRLLTQLDPAVLLVPPRILRRVIKRDRGLTGLGLQVPHRKSYLIDRERLLTLADVGELGIEPNRALPPRLCLFPLPDRQRLASDGRSATLLRFWRLLFHSRIHAALDGKDGDERHERIQRIGRTEFDEAASVLRQERFLLPPGDMATTYVEFAAVYLELRYFAPQTLSFYFPACLDRERIEAVWAEELDAEALFAATRPADIELPFGGTSPLSQPARLEPLSSRRVGDVPRAYLRLIRRADKAAVRGNLVRAAIFRMRAVALAPAGQAGPTRAAAHREMEQFSQRLQKALGYSDAAAADWRRALFALLEPAARGFWPSESRLLYDLQKACIDREKPAYAVDLIEWLITWGRRPIKRLLPFHDMVRLVKHLRGAFHRLTAVRIDESIRRRLVELLEDAAHSAEHRLRERLRPLLRDALDKVGLQPRFVVEKTAREKVVEELIDRVVECGFLNLGDLRDALARNRLKLADLTDDSSSVPNAGTEGPLAWLRAGMGKLAHAARTFFLGDELLRASRELAVQLDGIYRRGEIYLRWLQRFSAAAFGTHLGRWLVLYVALPFGCSLALLKTWEHLLELVHGAPPEGSEEAIKAAKHLNLYAFTLIGLFFLAVFHFAPLRRFLLDSSVRTWHGLRWLIVDLPTWLFRRSWIAHILQSGPWLFCYQFILKPMPLAVLCSWQLYNLGLDISSSLAVGAGVFAAGNILLNSRLGAYLEEVGTDRLVRTWQLIHADLVPGLVRWVIYFYRRLQEQVERFIYTVDEWLVFRPNDSRWTLFAKPVLGSIWFFVTYGFRFLFNLFVEPTFNPIKHFPVVTVTAKLIVPIIPTLGSAITTQLAPLVGKAASATAAAAVIFFIPGLAGFLVWELKENWRLYRANQSPTLRPEIVGHHGETMLRLMRPGLHSGTLPKLFARLRHGRDRLQRKQFEALHHLRDRLRHFVERNLFAVLADSKSWSNAVPLQVGDIHLATNRIRIELAGSASWLLVDFEQRQGSLFAELTHPNGRTETWLNLLSPEQSNVFRDALAGLFQRAGIDNTPPILWADWLQTWQADAEGKGHLSLDRSLPVETLV
jgi:hypothetical protein